MKTLIGLLILGKWLTLIIDVGFTIDSLKKLAYKKKPLRAFSYIRLLKPESDASA